MLIAYHVWCFVFFAENKRKVEMIEQLKSRGYASDPVKAWKESISEREDDEEGSENGEEITKKLLQLTVEFTPYMLP